MNQKQNTFGSIRDLHIKVLSHLTLGSSENGEERQEEVDDVQVERHCCPDVLIVTVTFDEIVCVIHYVAAEYYRCQAAVDHHWDPSQREKYLHNIETKMKLKFSIKNFNQKKNKENNIYLNKGKDHENDDSTKQEWAEEVEVISFLCRPEGVEG